MASPTWTTSGPAWFIDPSGNALSVVQPKTGPTPSQPAGLNAVDGGADDRLPGA